MKCNLLVTFCFILVLTIPSDIARAQTETGFGIRAGINLADNQFKADDFDETYGNRTALLAGLFVIIPINSNFALQPELWYIQKGGEASASFSFFDEDFSFSSALLLDYLEIPVLARYQPVVSGRARPSLVAGPSAGFLMKAKSRIKIGGESETADIKSQLRTTDISLLFGGGLEFSSGLGRLSLDLRYMLGLTNILKTDNNEAFNDPFDDDFDEAGEGTIRNRGLTLTLGLRF
jgi:hypothetical protein